MLISNSAFVLLHSLSTTSICRIVLQKLSIIVEFMAIFSNILLRLRRNRYFWTSGVNLDTAVRIPDPDFLSECKFSAIWWRFPLTCILYAECPPHFYFRFVWPTDLESIPHASTPTSTIPTKFEVDMTILCRVIAFLSAETSRDLVTLTFDLLKLSSWLTWRVTWPTLPPSLKTLRLFVHELRVITFFIDYCKKNLTV